MESMSRKFVWTLTGLFGILALGWVIYAAAFQSVGSSRAYVGHEADVDMKRFIHAYQNVAGTRLEDCQTCHRGGIRGTDTESDVSPCSYCHLVVFPNPRYQTGVPRTFADTLNSYGRDYNNAGRDHEAFAAIDGRDSDGDGRVNGAEIADLRNPGDPASRPGLPIAPFVTLEWDDILALPPQTQFMLMNKTKQFLDEYVTYKGARVSSVLAAAGVDLGGVSGITVFAPDGFSVDIGLDEVTNPFPKGVYYEVPRRFPTPEMGFLQIPASVPLGLADGTEIPGTPWLLLAYERDGQLLDEAVYEKGSGSLAGEGPFRLVRPQRDLMGDPARPGRPDRSINADRYGDGWDYSAKIDHNAGACVRGTCVIRINPVPPGYEEYDWKNGWSLVAGRKIVVFGRGVKQSL